MQYEFMLELNGPGGKQARVQCARVDWHPAREYARWAAICAGRLAPTTGCPPVGLEPVWTENGGPYVTGVRPVLWPNAPGRYTPAETVPLTYFRTAAQEAASDCVAAGTFQKGDRYSYRVMAFAADTVDEGPHGGLDVEEMEQPLALHAAALRAYVKQAAVKQAEYEASGDTPVFVPEHVIEDAREVCRRNLEVETGGLLIGRLCRDTADGARMFIEITGQIPAAHTDADAMRLTFTPASWAAARAALALRNSDEMILGWWHLHPFWCRRCSADKRAVCPLAKTFFSTTDCALHRSIFEKAYHVALLLTDGESGLVPAMFGWRRGTITSIPFGIVGGADAGGMN